MKRSWLAGLVATSLLAGIVPPQSVHAEDKVNEKKEKLKSIKEKKDEIKESIDQLKEKIRPRKEKVEGLEKKISETNKKIHQAEVKKEKNKKQLKYYERLFKNRIRLMYEQGELGSMQALFESENFSDFLERFETLRLIVMRDRSLFDQYDKIRKEQDALKQKHLKLADKQKEEAEKARKLYDEVNKEIQKTEKKLQSLNAKESSIQSELDKLTLVDASLYPFKFASTAGVDPWGFFNRQCTSFVAWRMNQHGQKFSNTMRGGHFGNAENWDDNARAIGMSVNQSPSVGAIAQFDPGASNAGSVGHVAYVTDVNGSTVSIEEYNMDTPLGYGKRTLPVSGVSNFIHVD
ncbi:CHAP domain-containing protein [Salinithrix halophila]|uniref:CHAP domain-containing protein n=1 Tax=Salinithrix halophila TaxID=1485204 RepID=A0ABV8JA57_9BACL